jgi:hypothetical protein
VIGAGMRITRLVQRPGDLVLTMPGAYHAGFAHGFSVAESSNFADAAWLETTGRQAAQRMAQAGVQPAFDIAQLASDWKQAQAEAEEGSNADADADAGAPSCTPPRQEPSPSRPSTPEGISPHAVGVVDASSEAPTLADAAEAAPTLELQEKPLSGSSTGNEAELSPTPTACTDAAVEEEAPIRHDGTPRQPPMAEPLCRHAGTPPPEETGIGPRDSQPDRHVLQKSTSCITTTE